MGIRYEFCVRSGNSEKRGVGSVKNIVESAKLRSIAGLALCDNYSTNGYDAFSRACKNYEMKAMFGVTLFVEHQRVLAIAKNPDGIKDINKLISIAIECKDDEFFYENTYDQLSLLHDNLIYIGIIKDEDSVSDLFMKYDYLAAPQWYTGYTSLSNDVINSLIVIGDTFYPEPADKFLHEVLIGKKVEVNQCIKSDREILLKKHIEDCVCKNTSMIADLIQDDCYKRANTRYSTPVTTDIVSFINKVYEKVKEKFKEIDNSTKQRIDFEINGIAGNENTVYQLEIFSKIAEFLSSNNQSFYLAGLGSSSIICYILGMSSINPMDYDIPPYSLYGYDFSKCPAITYVISPLFTNKLEKFIINLLGKDNVIKPVRLSTYRPNECLDMVTNYLAEHPYDYSSWDLTEARVFYLSNTVNGKEVCKLTYYVKSSDDDFNRATPYRHIDGEEIPISLNDDEELISSFFHFNILESKEMTFENELKNSGIEIPSNYYEDEQTLSLLENDKALNKLFKLTKVKNGLRNVYDLGDVSNEDIINKTKPHNIHDAIKVCALSHGSYEWESNYKKLLEQGYTLDDLICSREDTYNLLTKKYSVDDKTAYFISEDVRKGRKLKLQYEQLLKEIGVDDNLINFMNSCRYLFPKAGSINYALIGLKQAYVKVHYPEVFYKLALLSKADVDLIKEVRAMPMSKLFDLEQEMYDNLDIEHSKSVAKFCLSKILIEMEERGFAMKFDENNNFEVHCCRIDKMLAKV